MKKICIISHGLASGGISSFVINLIIGMKQQNEWDISLIMALDCENSRQMREDEIEKLGSVSIYRTSDIRGPKDILRHFVALYRLLKKLKPDVVHSNMVYLDGLNCFAAALAGVPIRVSHAHNSNSYSATEKGGSLKLSVYYWMMRKIVWTFSNRHAGCSELAMDYFYGPKWRNNKHSQIIFNGIDLKKFESVNRADAIRKFKFDENIFRIIVVGRLANQKNPLFTVEIMKELCKLRRDCELIWVGTGNLKDRIDEKIKLYNLSQYIKMFGARKDVNEILKCGDVFLLPGGRLSPGDRLSQAAGLPCVTSNRVPELADCGKCIFLPLEDGAASWAKAISDIIDGKIQMQIDEEKLSRFDISYMTSQLEQVYEK